MEKRKSCRAIIIDKNKLVAMYREKNNKVYYTFPGGGIEENETELECVKRECREEFGIEVEPVRKLYILEDEKSIQNFYLCNWIYGALGEGDGEEFSDQSRGVYIPSLLPFENINSLPLVPPEIKEAVLKDYDVENQNFDKVQNVEVFKSSFNG